MSVDRGMLFVVPILIGLGSIVGVVLSIVPMLVYRLWRHRPTAVSRALHALYLTAYVGIGLWVHHSMGVTYTREVTAYTRDFAADELCKFCYSPIDGRQGWILLWVVAGLVAYALRSGAAHVVLDGLGGQAMQWFGRSSADESGEQRSDR